MSLLAANIALIRIEDRVLDLSPDSQARAKTLATVIEQFAAENGAIGHVALNLATARMAVKVFIDE